ncbi:MAG: hypothetical protein WBZ01_16380 [Terriglobales bacterium]
MPQEIVLTLDDGTTFHHPGGFLEFGSEVSDQMRKGGGPLVEALLRTVSAEGCGRLWELMRAVYLPIRNEADGGHEREKGRST